MDMVYTKFITIETMREYRIPACVLERKNSAHHVLERKNGKKGNRLGSGFLVFAGGVGNTEWQNRLLHPPT